MFDYDEYYRKISAKYDRIRLDHKEDFSNTVAIVLSQCLTRDSRILDIGCGTGRYGQTFKDNGYSVIGIDRSESQVKQAATIIDARIANATQIPFQDSTFNVCSMIMMIHHLSHDERRIAFDEVSRVLCNNGTLVIKTCSHMDLPKRLTSKFFPKALRYDIERYPEIEVLSSELKKHFVVEVVSTEITVEVNKETTISNFSQRKSSNLGMLSKTELKQGLQRMEAYYIGIDIINKTVCNTFLLCKKE
jgi:ubiquinone/menaquinone biosynthesis C-methylase UbiE